MSRSKPRAFLDNAVLSRLGRLTLSARVPMLGSVTGIHKSAARGSSVEFAEYRKYAPGDDLRHLDWRVLARTDRFYIKEFEADTNLRCHLVVDASASMGFDSRHGTKFDYACRMSATLAYLLSHQGDAVGLSAFNDKTFTDIPPRRTASHLRNIYDTLEGLKPQGPTQLVKTLHDLAEKIRNRGLVILFSDCFTEPEELIPAFQHLRFSKHDVAVFHLLAPEEVNFDFDRPIRFQDLESPFSMITDPSTVRRAYREALDAYLIKMQRGCREQGVDYHRVLLSTPYDKTLSSFLLERTRQAAGGRR